MAGCRQVEPSREQLFGFGPFLEPDLIVLNAPKPDGLVQQAVVVDVFPGSCADWIQILVIYGQHFCALMNFLHHVLIMLSACV